MTEQAELLSGHVIVAGFGVPGRMVAGALMARQRPFCVIELNPATVERCARSGLRIIAGDARLAEVLKLAGIDRASMLIVALPNDATMLETVTSARRLNPKVHIVARCAFTSAGLEARSRGADEVVVAEQAVAQEMTRVVEAH